MIGTSANNEFVDPNNKCVCGHLMPLPQMNGKYCPECGVQNISNVPKLSIEMGQRKALECYKCGNTKQFCGKFCSECGSQFIMGGESILSGETLHTDKKLEIKRCPNCDTQQKGTFCIKCASKLIEKIPSYLKIKEIVFIRYLCEDCNMTFPLTATYCSGCAKKLEKRTIGITVPLK